mgnify:CR=1 FL=1
MNEQKIRDQLKKLESKTGSWADVHLERFAASKLTTLILGVVLSVLVGVVVIMLVKLTVEVLR